MAKLRIPANKRKLALIVFAIVVALGIAGYILFVKSQPANAPEPESHQAAEATPETKPEQSSEPKATPPPAFNKSLYSLTDPNSLWVVVNKRHPLPSTYAPRNLTNVAGQSMRPEAAQAAQQLLNAASASGVKLKISSAYRSFGTQQSLYQSYVRSDGQAKADTYSARPGYSEHQTGLVADLGNANGSCHLEICFANTAGGQWLAQHAHEYGFIIRYPQGKTHITGYQYEPWHIRYVGKDLAARIKNSGQTMEEFFGLPAAPGY